MWQPSAGNVQEAAEGGARRCWDHLAGCRHGQILARVAQPAAAHGRHACRASQPPGTPGAIASKRRPTGIATPAQPEPTPASPASGTARERLTTGDHGPRARYPAPRPRGRLRAGQPQDLPRRVAPASRRRGPARRGRPAVAMTKRVGDGRMDRVDQGPGPSTTTMARLLGPGGLRIPRRPTSPPGSTSPGRHPDPGRGTHPRASPAPRCHAQVDGGGQRRGPGARRASPPGQQARFCSRSNPVGQDGYYAPAATGAESLQPPRGRFLAEPPRPGGVRATVPDPVRAARLPANQGVPEQPRRSRAVQVEPVPSAPGSPAAFR